MLINLCLACRRVNLPDARACAACGADLEDFDSLPQPRHEPAPTGSSGSLWLEDVLESGHPPQQASGGPGAELTITLRDLTPPPPPIGRKPAVTRRLEPFVSAESVVPRPPDGGQVDRHAGGETPADVAARRIRRAERRATVRRARLRAQSEAAGDSTQPSEVLVLDADGPSREQLCALLRRFGFLVHETDVAMQAFSLTVSRRIVAAFVGIAPEAAGDIGLINCRRISELRARSPVPATLLVGMARRALPIDRVHADLAGCDELIVKPVTRGAVARVLDERAIAMPMDARRV